MIIREKVNKNKKGKRGGSTWHLQRAARIRAHVGEKERKSGGRRGDRTHHAHARAKKHAIHAFRQIATTRVSALGLA